LPAVPGFICREKIKIVCGREHLIHLLSARLFASLVQRPVFAKKPRLYRIINVWFLLLPLLFSKTSGFLQAQGIAKRT
jgi:hypothetical protein